MNCLQVRELLPELAVGVLGLEDRTAVERHLQWCAGCRKEAGELGSAAATIAFALAPAAVPGGLAERVVGRIRSAAGAPGSRRRARTAVASIVAAMVGVAGLGWGAVMAGRADRFADRAREAELSKVRAIEQFRKAFSGVSGLLGTAPSTNEMHLGQLAPASGDAIGGGAALELLSPTTLDFVIVRVAGLDPTDKAALPYRVTVGNASGRELPVGKIRELSATDGSADVFHQFNFDLTGFTQVRVVDARGDVVLHGSIDQRA